LSRDSGEDDTPPAKKPRLEGAESVLKAGERRPLTQIISSLFTHNPPVEAPLQNAPPKSISKPSNAPLDGSLFTGLGLDPLITAHLNNKMNIHKPTSIQRAVLSSFLSTSSPENSTRDVFIQSETGSGKTLSFLLPVLQDLLPLSSLSYIDRSIGTLAIIITPTRELAKQISEVLDTLLKLRLRPEDDAGDDDNTSTRMTRWLVSGLLIGGATRAHEKARLRKGIPILVSTPGRLLDHLQNTSSFNVGKCRWLILDEADRLMELGFEETIAGIMKSLSGRRRLALQAVQEGNGTEVDGWDWERPRRTILCSATIREDVQKLAGTVLHNPLVIKATKSDQPSDELSPQPAKTASPGSQKFTPPSQLMQKFIIVPLKLRLVGLVALLRSLLAKGRRGSKIIVFMSCTDSVDFHWRLIGASSLQVDEPSSSEADTSDEAQSSESSFERVKTRSPLLQGASIYRLHGSLSTTARLSALHGFSTASAGNPKTPASAGSSILLCTSVASRGLDLPLVRAVIQYDLPTEGGTTEYLHRVGRTARAGKGGEAWSMVAPSEAEWVKLIADRMTGDLNSSAQHPISLDAVTIENVLADGFGGEGHEYEKRATEVQLSFEHWILLRQEVLAVLSTS
jgi:ATP-dependent RNA helicase DDX31/DBP7